MIENIDHDKCTGCGICAEVCPLDVLRVDPFREEVPPCQQSCPAGVDVRAYNNFLKNRMPWEAARVLRTYLPYPAITGRLCYHPCESNCARREVDEAVNIHGLERYVADYCLREGADCEPMIHARKAAVIGAGPAGLAAAYFLCRMGYGVTVFESGLEIGGIIAVRVNSYESL